jgi:uncharacterized protein YbjT (DUF2867 family)
MRVAVAGGTGAVGRHVVRALAERGHAHVVLSRSTGVDLMTGEGLDAALEGVDAVIDVASVQTLSPRVSLEFFGTTTRRLLAAERAAGGIHHIALSIVGAAEIDAAYYAGKAEQERLVQASGAPWSILRATQFHEFAQQMLQRGRMLGAYVVPVMHAQPVAAAEVAAALVDIAEGAPRGLDRDLAGPREERMADMVRRLLRATGRPGPVLEVRLPGRMGAASAHRGLLPGPDARLGRETFEQWLASPDAQDGSATTGPVR